MTSQTNTFLTNIGWDNARRTPLAGDASARRYERLTQGPNGQTSILMIDPSDTRRALDAFVTIAKTLTNGGFSAPQILHAEPASGLLLLEDLGDDLFTQYARDHPATQTALYEAACDLLQDLQKLPAAPICAQPTSSKLASMTGLAYDFYMPTDAPKAKHATIDEITVRLDALQPYTPVLALRDYHADNLIWLPDRAGIKRVGLLDFQDAFVTHPAYDLASLIRDARRDIPDPLARDLINRFAQKSDLYEADFHTAFAIVAVQRNLRILGIFSRLALRDGKAGYLDYIPRVWRHLMRDLSHPSLHRLHEMITADLPQPSPKLLQHMRELCPVNQTQS